MCKLEKEDECFSWRNIKKAKKQPYCKECRKLIDLNSKNLPNFKERKDKNKNNSRKRNARFIGEILKKSKCKDCGESNPIVLEFDHICNKIGNISDMVNSGFSIENLKLEIEKCEIRCANCHRIKTAKQFKWFDKFN